MQAWCEPHEVAALRLPHFQERIHDRDQIVGELIEIGEQVELVAGKRALERQERAPMERSQPEFTDGHWCSRVA